MTDRREGRSAALALWVLLSFVCTLVLRMGREQLDDAHVVLVYLVLVLAASAREGRAGGLVLSVVAFFQFNFFLLPPYHTLSIADPFDWWILVAFLITGGVAAQLLHRAQRAASLAEHRAEEIERLAGEARQVEVLRAADRLKDALLTSVSHDLRTPLTTIRATAAGMREEGHQEAAIIEGEAERLNRLVTDLLDLSRIRAGALSLETEINAAEDLIGAALLELRRVDGSERVEVTMSTEEPVPVGRFDFVHTLRALVNLLENAIQHSTPSRPIGLELELSDEALDFIVRDEGPGIPPEDELRLFEPFYRGVARRAGVAGSGLGLAIARSLARAQDGDVTYRRREDGGSEFRLSVPRVHLPPIP